MGMKWGNISHVRGTVTYGISPFEVKLFNNVMTRVVPNWIRRIKSQFLYVAPPLLGTYYLYHTVENMHAQMTRKDPADYENDS